MIVSSTSIKEDLPKLWGKLSLSEEEDVEFEVQKAEVRGGCTRPTMCRWETGFEVDY